jgi:hypothetical protein
MRNAATGPVRRGAGLGAASHRHDLAEWHSGLKLAPNAEKAAAVLWRKHERPVRGCSCEELPCVVESRPIKGPDVQVIRS